MRQTRYLYLGMETWRYPCRQFQFATQPFAMGKREESYGVLAPGGMAKVTSKELLTSIAGFPTQGKRDEKYVWIKGQVRYRDVFEKNQLYHTGT